MEMPRERAKLVSHSMRQATAAFRYLSRRLDNHVGKYRLPVLPVNGDPSRSTDMIGVLK